MKRPFFLERRFWPMWTALSFGAFADNMLRQSLIIGVAFGALDLGDAAKSEMAIPVIGSFFAVSMFIFSPLAGQVAEKYETAMLFRRIKFAEIVLMSIAAIGFLLNAAGLLIAVLFAMGAQSAFFSPVRFSAMPKYLHADELVRGNGLCNAGLFVSVLVGLFLGGLMIGEAGGRSKVAAFLFAAAVIGWLAVLFAPRATENAPDIKLDYNPFPQAVHMTALAFRAPGVAWPLLGGAFFFFTSTMVTVLVPLYARASLGGDEKSATAIMGVFAIGAGIGALAASAISKKRSALGFSTAGVALASVSAIAIYVLTGPAAASGGLFSGEAAGAALAVSFCLAAIAMGLFLAPLQAAVQRRAPAAERGRILATGNMLNAAAAIGGSLSVLTVTQTALDPRTAFLILAALQGAVVLYMSFRWRTVPRGQYDNSLEASVENKA